MTLTTKHTTCAYCRASTSDPEQYPLRHLASCPMLDSFLCQQIERLVLLEKTNAENGEIADEAIRKLDDALERCALLERSDAANAELAELALRQRDEYKRLLQELLAVIHRDGGHHTEARGLGPSCLDAREVIRTLQQERDLAVRECARYQALGYHRL